MLSAVLKVLTKIILKDIKGHLELYDRLYRPMMTTFKIPFIREKLQKSGSATFGLYGVYGVYEKSLQEEKCDTAYCRDVKSSL